MAKKLYLSAAAHQYDNPTACPIKCGENIHCKAYMDLVETRMREQGVEVQRGYRDTVGTAAMVNRVAQANKWGADLYYVAHTNAGGGRYSLTLCWSDTASQKKAAVMGKYRKCIKTHKVRVRTDLYEIRKTKMPCLYDELFFHDNAADCAWFHSGGMEQLAEETVQALCELLEVSFVPPITKRPESEAPFKPTPPKAGDKVVLNKSKLYLASTGKTHVIRSGTYYVYDGICLRGRYRITNKPTRVGKTPIALNVSGWAEI